MTVEKAEMLRKMCEASHHIVHKVLPVIMSQEKMSVKDFGEYVDMVKDASIIEKNIAKIHMIYGEHTDREI